MTTLEKLAAITEAIRLTKTLLSTANGIDAFQLERALEALENHKVAVQLELGRLG